MRTFNWNSNFEIGVEEVDEQHKELVKIINNYSELLSSNSETIESIDKTLEKLITYTKFHFREEEALMHKVGLDSRHIKLHKKLHHELVEEINSMIPKKKFRQIFI